MNNRFEYIAHTPGYGLIRPRTSIFMMPVDTAPIEVKPEPPRQFGARMHKQYREKGYPLGKTKRGFKKWVKGRLLKALDCKSFKQALRKCNIK